MDVDKELARMERRLKARLDDDVKAAEQRIAALTPTEWEEVRAGLREHPRAAAFRGLTEAFRQIGARWRAGVEAMCTVVEGLTQGFAGQEGENK